VVLAFGFFLMRGGQPAAEPSESVAAADALTSPAVLLPPPPEVLFDEPDPEPILEIDPAGQAAPARAAGVPAEPVAPGDDPADPRWRLGGPSIARFPDLPSPTLSKLARDGLKQMHDIDAAARTAAKRSAPPVDAQ
jgi:hypothetical protein